MLGKKDGMSVSFSIRSLISHRTSTGCPSAASGYPLHYTVALAGEARNVGAELNREEVNIELLHPSRQQTGRAKNLAFSLAGLVDRPAKKPCQKAHRAI